MSSKTVVNRQSLTYPGVCVCVCVVVVFVFAVNSILFFR